MREKIKDKARLEHILGAINVLIDNKDKHTYEDVVNVQLSFMAL